jgi:hypothetical protein
MPVLKKVLDYDNDALARIDRALDELRDALGPLQGMTPVDRRRLFKMGPKTETFCRRALLLLETNPDAASPSLDLPRAQTHLRSVDRLRPRLQRLQQLESLLADTITLLGVDVAERARIGFHVMRNTGKVKGLKPLEKHLGARYRRAPRNADKG